MVTEFKSVGQGAATNCYVATNPVGEGIEDNKAYTTVHDESRKFIRWRLDRIDASFSS